MYEKIQSEYNHFISSNDKQPKTLFMTYLANLIGTSLSNLYTIIKDGLITTLGANLAPRIEFNANTAFIKRHSKNVESIFSKRESSKEFVSLVIKEYRNTYNINSIDEIINDLKLNRPNEIKGLTTICTTTFYNYLDENSILDFSSSELPLKSKRTPKNESKAKSEPKGESIDNRPFPPDDRNEFGHWEGDTIVGSSKIKNSGAVLTLVERLSRFQITVKLKNRKALSVLKAFNKIAKLYPDIDVKTVFKSITFDNGVEFAKWKLIEKRFNTKIYFAHPYSSWQRGSNENGNKLLRIFLPKSCNITSFTEEFIMNANELINNKIRKILSYKSSLEVFNHQLAKLAI